MKMSMWTSKTRGKKTGRRRRNHSHITHNAHNGVIEGERNRMLQRGSSVLSVFRRDGGSTGMG